jgi:hypothetical protein
MLCQLISIFEAGKSSLFEVPEPFDNARSNVIFFEIGSIGFPLRSFYNSRHGMQSYALGYKDFEKMTISCRRM